MGIRKSAHRDPGVPNFFLKAPSCLTGHNKPIIIEEHFGDTIPELELAAVIGRRCRKISVEEARDAIFGYTITNDVTSHGLKFGLDSIATTREPDLIRPHHLAWRKRHGDDDRDVYFVYHARSKATDTFGPMGPWLTTADEVADPNNLEVKGWFDGEPFAVDSTSSYRFRIEEVVAEASRYFTLQPGDVICFGTSAKGVGKFPNGHRSVNMHKLAGVIDIEIEGLGRLSNPVVHDWER
nr:fumarylacetoacetate hydrolase family protein [Chelativorans petroleitrophicus]